MYVISYDIENDRIRNKIAKTLEGYGKRVQYSVFECRLSKDRFESLYKRLAKLMRDEKEGNIRFYKICRNCESDIATIGIVKEAVAQNEQDLFII